MAKSPRQIYDPKTDYDHIDDLLCDAGDKENLTCWEEEFIEDMIRKLEKSRIIELTPAQYKTLEKIANRKDNFEVW